MNNIIIDYFLKGGWIMWPMLGVSIVAFGVVFERLYWWKMEDRLRNRERLDLVYQAVQRADLKVASGLCRSSEDPVLRVIWHGLNHYNASLQGALQVAAGIEIERSGRFLVVLDTIVTLAPLLGLLGTVTGLMKAFFKLGSAEISPELITGGIAEALIATACGLTIAVVCLIALNYFSAKVAKFTFELQTVCTNLEVMFSGLEKKKLIDYEVDLSLAS